MWLASTHHTSSTASACTLRLYKTQDHWSSHGEHLKWSSMGFTPQLLLLNCNKSTCSSLFDMLFSIEMATLSWEALVHEAQATVTSGKWITEGQDLWQMVHFFHWHLGESTMENSSYLNNHWFISAENSEILYHLPSTYIWNAMESRCISKYHCHGHKRKI